MEKTSSERLTALEERYKAMEMRLEKLEGIVDTINSLTISVEKMSVVLSAQSEGFAEMNARLMKIENEPGDAWKNVKSQVIAALVAGIVTAIFFSAN